MKVLQKAVRRKKIAFCKTAAISWEQGFKSSTKIVDLLDWN
jgi:hypothetical protein